MFQSSQKCSKVLHKINIYNQIRQIKRAWAGFTLRVFTLYYVHSVALEAFFFTLNTSENMNKEA